MKLRIRGNSIRLRLLQSEVAGLRETGVVTERTHLAGAALTYSLRSANSANEISALLDANEISVFLPENVAKEWAESDAVGLSAEQKIDDTNILKILVEKDYTCLDRRDDPDNADAFPHPRKSC